MHLWVLVLFILSSCCSSDCFNLSRKRLVININSILDNRRHHHIDTICDDKTTNIMTIPSVKSSETSSTLLWIYKVMVSASLLIAVALPLPAHSEIDSKLLKKSLSTDVPIQTIQTNNKSPQQAAKVKTHRVLLREERRLETATQTRDFFKQRLDKANSALTKKKARLFVLQGQKRQGEAEIMKLDRLLKLMKKSVNNSSRDSLRSLVTALSHERQILFDVELEIKCIEKALFLSKSKLEELQKRLAAEEELVKRTRGELNDVVKRRNSEISVEKGKEDKFIKTQHKGIFQASNQKSDVGVGTLSLLTGLSYLNAVQAFKKSSKGTTFGELFRSEAVLALVASVVSLFIVFIL